MDLDILIQKLQAIKDANPDKDIEVILSGDINYTCSDVTYDATKKRVILW